MKYENFDEVVRIVRDIDQLEETVRRLKVAGTVEIRLPSGGIVISVELLNYSGDVDDPNENLIFTKAAADFHRAVLDKYIYDITNLRASLLNL